MMWPCVGAELIWGEGLMGKGTLVLVVVEGEKDWAM